jgi:hypothetical protein
MNARGCSYFTKDKDNEKLINCGTCTHYDVRKSKCNIEQTIKGEVKKWS